MESAETQGKSGPEQSAFGASWEQFGQLLRAVLSELPTATGTSINDQSLARLLAVEFERWLRDPASMPPWWQNLHTLSSLAAPHLRSGQPSHPGSAPGMDASPPLSAQSDVARTSQRVAGLLARWSQLQARLAMYWNGVARTAGERFIAGAAKSPAVLDLRTIRQLYDSWIECAEQAYAETVHSDDFCRTQAELVNTSTALLLEQRRHVESLAPVFGLASRSEVDELRAEMRRTQSEPRSGSGRRASKRRRRKGRAT